MQLSCEAPGFTGVTVAKSIHVSQKLRRFGYQAAIASHKGFAGSMVWVWQVCLGLRRLLARNFGRIRARGRAAGYKKGAKRQRNGSFFHGQPIVYFYRAWDPH